MKQDAETPEPLSSAETNQLIAAAQAGDTQARNTLVEANLRLVRKRAHAAARRCGRPAIADDLIQTAIAGVNDNDGLIHAIEKFDLSRGLRFSTYAVRWIDNAIQNAVAGLGTVRMGRHSHGEARLRNIVAELTSEDGVPPTPREVRARCVFLGFEAPTDIAIARSLTMVFEEQLPHEAETGNNWAEGRFPSDIRAATDDPDPEAALQDREQARLLLAALDALSTQERYVLEASEGLFGAEPRKLVELAAELGISRQRVGQIKAAALEKLRAHVARGDGESWRNPSELPSTAALEAA